MESIVLRLLKINIGRHSVFFVSYFIRNLYQKLYLNSVWIVATGLCCYTKKSFVFGTKKKFCSIKFAWYWALIDFFSHERNFTTTKYPKSVRAISFYQYQLYGSVYGVIDNNIWNFSSIHQHFQSNRHFSSTFT